MRENDRGSNASCTEKIKNIFFVVLLTKLCVLMTNIANQFFFIEEKMHSISSLQQFLMSLGMSIGIAD